MPHHPHMRRLHKYLTTSQWIVVVLSTLAVGSLFLAYLDRIGRFEASHRALAQTLSAEVANQVTFILNERQRQVQLYAEDHLPLLRRLEKDPDNTTLQKQVALSLQRSFPDVLSFTFTDANGQPLITDFDGYVGDLCVQDIQAYVQNGHYAARIHPNHLAYHYDVMARWPGSKGQSYMLMVSFPPTELGHMLKTVEPPGHQLMLATQAERPLIEVTAEGARNRTVRDDYRLSPQELDRLLARHAVERSQWQVMDVARPSFFEEFQRQTLINALVLLAMFGLVIGASLVLLRREDERRKTAEREREDLFSVITHEMRTPVSTISSTLALLRQGVLGDLPPRLQNGVSMIERNAERLRRLIDDLLECRRIESGQLSLQKLNLNLTQSVQETLMVLNDYAQQSEVRLVLSAPEEPLWVLADPTRLQQISTNLISNAAKFAPRGSTVQISLLRNDKGMARVCVRDEGPGIPAHLQPRIFEKFIRGPAKPNRQIAGTGLGLSIVKTLVEAHGGQVGVESGEGQGATFHFDLPLLPASTTAGVPKALGITST